MLLRDQFADALQDAQLQVYVKQAHVDNLQDALARALEFESFMKTSAISARRYERADVQPRRSQVRGRVKKRRGGQFGGSCWGCGREGHRRQDCPDTPRSPRSLSADRGRQGASRPCCWECGQPGHMARSCPEARSSGNDARLSRRASGQTGTSRPHS